MGEIYLLLGRKQQGSARHCTLAATRLRAFCRDLPSRAHGLEGVALGPPSGDATDHLLHRESERGQAGRGTRCPVAVRSPAVGDEHRVARQIPGRHLVDRGVRKVARTRKVAGGERRGRAGIDDDDAARAADQVGVHVGAVGLEPEAGGKVLSRFRGRRSGHCAHDRRRQRAALAVTARSRRPGGQGCATRRCRRTSNATGRLGGRP